MGLGNKRKKKEGAEKKKKKKKKEVGCSGSQSRVFNIILGCSIYTYNFILFYFIFFALLRTQGIFFTRASDAATGFKP
jgi:hypothetical protein